MHSHNPAVQHSRHFARWEAMMNAYNPWRRRMIECMLLWPEMPADEPIRILDLGCGPGSLAFQAAAWFRKATVYAVDYDPVLLAVGYAERHHRNARRVHFVHGDLRDAAVWANLPHPFDLVMSSMALHTLPPAQLADVYRRSREILRPGGWLINGDQFSFESSEVQQRNVKVRDACRRVAFFTTGAPSWERFWAEVQQAVPDVDVTAARRAHAPWDPSNDGLPLTLHLGILRRLGFDPAECIWQNNGDAVVAARKPF